MRLMPIRLWLSFLLLFLYNVVLADDKSLTLTGKLERAMAIGGESTGWSIHLDSPLDLNGKQANSIEVESKDTTKLEKLANKQVRASGKLSTRQGVETGERSILQVSSIKQVRSKPSPKQTGADDSAPLQLTGTEWILEDLAGTGVVDNVQATLAFPEAGKIAGRGSCNRFFGTADIKGNALKFGPLGSTRMACPEAVMNQETKYMKALEAAERFEWKDPYLLIYCQGFEKPLRFTKSSAH